MKLLLNALTKFICGLLLVGLLIFLPAGTLCYTYGWLFIGLLFVPMLIAGFVMFFKSPDFLAKRLDAKEKQRAQKGVVALSGLMFIAVLGFWGLILGGGLVLLLDWLRRKKQPIFGKANIKYGPPQWKPIYPVFSKQFWRIA